MITKNNFKGLLQSLNFSEDGYIFSREFETGAVLSVNFKEQKLIYPKEIKGGERNNGFNAPENFVVFECVCRLLEKGYQAKDIELEKEWNLGHSKKGGRADICVTGLDGSMLFIIECKTCGEEFEKAWDKTNEDGAQLFSYWQQEGACKWLVLYASDYNKEGKISPKIQTINCSDDKNIILVSERDKSIKLFRDAHTVTEKFEVWNETYQKLTHDDLIFSKDSVAYEIGVKPLLKRDLKEFNPEEKILSKFQEILRHNNVSDKENAFNRLVALFICKLVDEITKDEDDVVEFQYKKGTDTYETLQDRLQRLHKEGMENFMGEKIFYVSADYPENLFSNYTGSKREEAIKDLQNTIRILKFYSNNDFAFKDVHNEELFYQNGKILVEMVELFQKYRIVYPSKHQFLGDLFENLLNDGFKQNEGQFFTPMPIVRFIWDCLPIERMIKTEKGTVYPKVIDYACGAGHFLTEAVEAINYFANSDNNSWVKDHIYGIEKDYRLARVSKISLYMNGAGEGNIVFGDGLENAPDKGIENGIFDILVANPPYSVKDFKTHLQLKNNSFTLLDKIKLDSSSIETLFVERIGQLLKPKGIAAVILPSSFLSKKDTSYPGAREQILQNFYIRGIASFGNKTFGATGTNTVVMFLEKFNEPPKRIDLLSDSVDAIFKCSEFSDLTDWEDKEILDAYLAQIDVREEEYYNFLKKNYSLDELKKIDYFKMYVDDFLDKENKKKIKKKKNYDEQENIENFYKGVHSTEQEKLRYFSLVYQQTTVIITAPEADKEQKDFLGYEWSTRKGQEGIDIKTSGGKMYNDTNRSAEGTLANAVRKSFDGLIPSLNEEQHKFASVVATKDMLTFDRNNFDDKSISIKSNNRIYYKTKYEKIPLRDLAEIVKGTSITKAKAIPGEFKVVAGGLDYAYMHNQYNRESNIITVSASGANAGYVNYWSERIFASDCTTISSKNENIISTKLIYLFLKSIQKTIYSLQAGQAQPHVYPDDLAQLKIPVPPLDIQQKIVSEIEELEKKENESKNKIENLKLKINDIVSNVFESMYPYQFLKDLAEIVKGTSITKAKAIPGEFKVVAGGCDYAYMHNQYNREADIITVSASGTAGYVNYWSERIFASDCITIKAKTTLTTKWIYYFLKISQEQIYKLRKGANQPHVYPDDLAQLEIPVPPLDIQQKIVSEIDKIEMKIKALENEFTEIPKQKESVLRKWLN